MAGQRHHVHLSTDIDTATAVGQRYGKLVILEIDAGAMYQQGYKFFLSNNNVWLTEHVPPQLLNKITGRDSDALKKLLINELSDNLIVDFL